MSDVSRDQFVSMAMALPEPVQARLIAFLLFLAQGNPRAVRYWQMVEDGQIANVEQLCGMYFSGGTHMVCIEGGKP